MTPFMLCITLATVFNSILLSAIVIPGSKYKSIHSLIAGLGFGAALVSVFLLTFK